MVRDAKYLGSNQAAINWINGITLGSSRYFEWIDLVVESYNGCVRGRCSIFLDRWYHYDGKTRAIASEVARPRLQNQAWIGSECAQDSDCSSVEAMGRCLRGVDSGICVTSCEGLCPDRQVPDDSPALHR